MPGLIFSQRRDSRIIHLAIRRAGVGAIFRKGGLYFGDAVGSWSLLPALPFRITRAFFRAAVRLRTARRSFLFEGCRLRSFSRNTQPCH